MSEPFLPYETALMVLRYLFSQNCRSTAESFMKEMSCLQNACKNPDTFNSRTVLGGLNDILNDYGKSKLLVQDLVTKLAEWKTISEDDVSPYDTLTTQLRFIIKLLSSTFDPPVNNTNKISTKRTKNPQLANISKSMQTTLESPPVIKTKKAVATCTAEDEVLNTCWSTCSCVHSAKLPTRQVMEVETQTDFIKVENQGTGNNIMDFANEDVKIDIVENMNEDDDANEVEEDALENDEHEVMVEVVKQEKKSDPDLPDMNMQEDPKVEATKMFYDVLLENADYLRNLTNLANQQLTVNQQIAESPVKQNVVSTVDGTVASGALSEVDKFLEEFFPASEMSENLDDGMEVEMEEGEIMDDSQDNIGEFQAAEKNLVSLLQNTQVVQSVQQTPAVAQTFASALHSRSTPIDTNTKKDAQDGGKPTLLADAIIIAQEQQCSPIPGGPNTSLRTASNTFETEENEATETSPNQQGLTATLSTTEANEKEGKKPTQKLPPVRNQSAWQKIGRRSIAPRIPTVATAPVVEPVRTETSLSPHNPTVFQHSTPQIPHSTLDAEVDKNMAPQRPLSDGLSPSPDSHNRSGQMVRFLQATAKRLRENSATPPTTAANAPSFSALQSTPVVNTVPTPPTTHRIQPPAIPPITSAPCPPVPPPAPAPTTSNAPTPPALLPIPQKKGFTTPRKPLNRKLFPLTPPNNLDSVREEETRTKRGQLSQQLPSYIEFHENKARAQKTLFAVNSSVRNGEPPNSKLTLALAPNQQTTNATRDKYSEIKIIAPPSSNLTKKRGHSPDEKGKPAEKRDSHNRKSKALPSPNVPPKRLKSDVKTKEGEDDIKTRDSKDSRSKQRSQCHREEKLKQQSHATDPTRQHHKPEPKPTKPRHDTLKHAPEPAAKDSSNIPDRTRNNDSRRKRKEPEKRAPGDIPLTGIEDQSETVEAVSNRDMQAFLAGITACSNNEQSKFTVPRTPRCKPGLDSDWDSQSCEHFDSLLKKIPLLTPLKDNDLPDTPGKNLNLHRGPAYYNDNVSNRSESKSVVDTQNVALRKESEKSNEKSNISSHVSQPTKTQNTPSYAFPQGSGQLVNQASATGKNNEANVTKNAVVAKSSPTVQNQNAMNEPKRAHPVNQVNHRNRVQPSSKSKPEHTIESSNNAHQQRDRDVVKFEVGGKSKKLTLSSREHVTALSLCQLSQMGSPDPKLLMTPRSSPLREVEDNKTSNSFDENKIDYFLSMIHGKKQ